MADTVSYSQQGNVATIVLNRPDALNGFTPELCDDLLAAFTKANDENDVRAVVFTGEGRGFSTGADLKKGFEGKRSPEEKLQFEYRPVFEIISSIPKPVIAAVNGFAAGIGLSYAMHCDLVVMADDAFVLLPFTTISLVPDGGANWMLVKQLGYRRAYQLCIESNRLSASDCLELGLANKVVPAEELRSAAAAWAGQLCERAPLSLAATKKVMRHALDNDWASCFDMEATLQSELRDSQDAAEGVAAFLEKRSPAFTGK